jgi:hypothetical protein
MRGTDSHGSRVTRLGLHKPRTGHVEVVIKCKTLPRWFAGTRALDGGCCYENVSRYCRYVY